MVTSFKNKRTGNSYIAVDIETTGLSAANGDRVIEIGAVYIKNGQVISEFEQLIHTSRSIGREAQLIHGISNKMLHGQPLPEEVFPRFRQFIGDSVLIAHNERVDTIEGTCSRTSFHLNMGSAQGYTRKKGDRTIRCHPS
jgi:DNA polymerase III epsilon subunit-like protein